MKARPQRRFFVHAVYLRPRSDDEQLTLSSLVFSRPSGHDRSDLRYLSVHLAVSYGLGHLVRACVQLVG